MLIYHHAHSEFLLEAANGFRILTDPFDSHVGYAMHTVRCDAVTVSHGHGDHSFIDKAEGYQTTADRPGRVMLSPDIAVTGISCFHDDRQGALRGSNLIFVFEMDGLRIAHFGDLGAWDAALAPQLGHIDIALVPVGGYYTIDAGQAARIMDFVRPRVIIPMHYKTAATASWPIAPLEDCLEAMGMPAAPSMPLLRITREDLSEHPPLIVLQDLCAPA